MPNKQLSLEMFRIHIHFRPTHRAQAHGATVTNHDSTRKFEKHTNEDSDSLAMSPAAHGWAVSLNTKGLLPNIYFFRFFKTKT